MYQQFSDQRLRVMTGADSLQIPTLDIVRKLPTITMRLSEQYRAEKIHQNALNVLRRSAKAPSTGFVGFERQLTEIITGESSAWRLWRVDFYVARLKLYYVATDLDDDLYYRSGGISLDSPGHFRSCAYAYLLSPVSIGLDFDLPELNWQINCEMTSSAPTGSHTIRLSESLGGESTGWFTYNVPRIEQFVP